MPGKRKKRKREKILRVRRNNKCPGALKVGKKIVHKDGR